MHLRCNKYDERKTVVLVSLHCSYFFMLLMCYVALFLSGQFALQLFRYVAVSYTHLTLPTRSLV